MTITPRISHRNRPGGYEALVKSGAAILWACGHTHSNRDQSTQRGGMSARECAQRHCSKIVQIVNGRLVDWCGQPRLISAELALPIYRYQSGMTVGSGSYINFLYAEQIGAPLKIRGFAEDQVCCDLPVGGHGLLPRQYVAPHWDADVSQEIKDTFYALPEKEGRGILFAPPSGGYGSPPVGWAKDGMVA